MDRAALVSIICITYNHEKYIAQAIEGFLLQRTSFAYEILIHDDCSTDNTADIIRSYVESYPGLIKPIFQTVNQYSLGKKITPIVLPLCKGKYVALCEGDDYWTDPFKLQKQVNFLESNLDFVLSFHNSLVISENSRSASYVSNKSQKMICTSEDLAKGNFIPTASCLFRNGLFYDFPDWFNAFPVGDWPLFLLISQYGKIGFLDEVMGVYRIHSGGLWSSSNQLKNMYRLRSSIPILDEWFGFKYTRQFRIYMVNLDYKCLFYLQNSNNLYLFFKLFLNCLWYIRKTNKYKLADLVHHLKAFFIHYFKGTSNGLKAIYQG